VTSQQNKEKCVRTLRFVSSQTVLASTSGYHYTELNTFVISFTTHFIYKKLKWEVEKKNELRRDSERVWKGKGGGDIGRRTFPSKLQNSIFHLLLWH